MVKLRHIAVLGGLLAGGIIGFVPVKVPAAEPAKQTQPAISEEASATLQRMGQTLRAEQLSFQARGFYEKLGYQEFGRLDYPPDHHRHFMRKRLILPE